MQMARVSRGSIIMQIVGRGAGDPITHHADGPEGGPIAWYKTAPNLAHCCEEMGLVN